MTERKQPIPAGTPEWHEARKHCITATDVAAILGESPYKTELDVWAKLTGKLEPEVLDEKSKPWLEWGRRSEPVVAGWYADETGRTTTPVGALVFDAELPWLAATPDYLTVDEERGKGALELKTTQDRAPQNNSAGALDWMGTKEVQWMAQLQLQIRVLGVSWGSITAAGPSLGLRYHDVGANATFIENLIAHLLEWREKFWLKDTPPPATGSDHRLLGKLYPEDKGTVIVLGYDFAKLAETEKLLAERIKGLTTERDALKAQVKEAMQDNTYAVMGDHIYSWKTSEVVTKAKPATPEMISTRRTLRSVKRLPKGLEPAGLLEGELND